MAVSTDPQVLVAQSRCFDTCIPPGEQPGVRTYLLALIAGVTDPTALLQAAECFISCIPPGSQNGVQSFLTAVLAGGSTDPSVLLNQATCFRSCVPEGAIAGLNNYLLANKAGLALDAPTIANNARCFSSCIPTEANLGIQSYLLGVISGQISASTPGNPTNPGPILTASRTFLNQPVKQQIILGEPPLASYSSVPSSVTGFAFASNLAFTFVVASWDTPSPNNTATEVWTSSDNITFVLAQTIAVPGTSANVAIPAIGSTTYCKVRRISASQQGPFTNVLLFAHSDWETRALANSGIAALASSKSIQNNFYSALTMAGLLGKMLAVNLFDNQRGLATQTRTPLIKGTGTDPWTSPNFGDPDATANGAISSGAHYMAPINDASAFYGSDTNAGFTVYSFNATAGANLYDFGYTNNVGTLAMALQVNNGGTTNAKIWNDTSLITLPTPGAGYYSANRVSATDFRLYFARSNSAHAQVGSSAAASGTRQAQHLDCLAVNAYEVPLDELFTPRTLSFVAFHQGLTAAESAAFFTAVQAALVYSGGGFA